MFQFGRFPTRAYFVQRALAGSSPAGFPHSEIHGSSRMCRSPWLIAACHVLRRLLMPRHSPCALSSLTSNYAGVTKKFRNRFFTLASVRRRSPHMCEALPPLGDVCPTYVGRCLRWEALSPLWDAAPLGAPSLAGDVPPFAWPPAPLFGDAAGRRLGELHNFSLFCCLAYYLNLLIVQFSRCSLSCLATEICSKR